MTDRFFTNALLAAAAATATQQIPVDVAAGGSEFITPLQIEAFAEPLIEAALTALRTATCKYSTDNNAGSISATGAQVAVPCNVVSNPQLVVLDLIGVLAAGANLTLPIVSALQAVLAASYTGQSYVFRVINNSSAAFSWTVVTNTGWTLNGTMTVAQNTYRDFLITITSAGSHTATLQNIGSGAN